MGLKITIDVSGLERLGELARLNLEEAVKLEAEAVAEEARSLCPRSARDEAGYLHLQDTIEAEQTSEYRAEVHDGKRYGIFVELGAQGRSGQPFMTPAFQRGQSRFPERVKRALEQAAKDAGRGK